MATGNTSKTRTPAVAGARPAEVERVVTQGADPTTPIRADATVERAQHPAVNAGQTTSSSSFRMAASISVVDASPNLDTQQTIISKDLPIAAPRSQAHLPPAEMGKVLLGTQLGHYHLQEFVGGGGMGAVFRALDTMLDRTVAVKVLSKVQSNDEETLRRFKNEAQSSARLDHDNIGRVHYVGEDQGWHYIVFEFIEGINLRDLVEQQGPLSLEKMVSFTLQISDALAHAANRDVVHRDIKPSNVLITPDSRAKLVDMGLARLHQVEHSANDLTASGVTLGTFDYISPEQARDPRNADVRSDIYSLGCTVYFMLTGRPPFPEGTVLQKLLQHQSDEPPDVRSLRPELPEEISRIQRRMLAKAPQQRYQHPEDLMAELMAVANKYNLSPPPINVALVRKAIVAQPQILTKQLAWLVPLAALLFAVCGLAIAGRFQRDDSAPPPIHHLATTASTSKTPASDPARDRKSRDPRDRGAAVNADSKKTTSVREGSSSLPAPPIASDGVGKKAPSPPIPANRGGSASSDTESSAGGTNDKSPASSEKSLAGERNLDSASAEKSSGKSFMPLPAAGIGELAMRHSSNLLPLLQNRLSVLLTGKGGDSGAETMLRIPWAAAGRGPNEATSANVAPAGNTNGDSSLAGPSIERRGLLIVSREHQSPNEYASIADACRAAKSGDVIEIRRTGLLEERPLNPTVARLTIRAGEGYSPNVSFQPTEGDLAQSRSMIALAGNQLTLIGLELQFDVPRKIVMDSWSLAEVRTGESLRMDNCTVTVRNASDNGGAYHPDVAIFNVRGTPGAGLIPMKDPPPARPAAQLQLKNCILRGEATVVRVSDAQPWQLTWENGLLATTERFVTASGGPSQPKPQGLGQLTLKHVTALVPGGFCQVAASQDAPAQLPLEFNVSDSILICKSGLPLIDQSGMDDPEDLRKKVTWNGERNFYEGFGSLWRIVGPMGTDASIEMTLSDWQTFWGPREIQPSVDQVAWKKFPASDRAPHLHTAADYGLMRGANPAHNSAGDGRDAGFQAEQLPGLDQRE